MPMYHNNLTFTDEKSLILNDLLKLRARKDPITGEVPNIVHGSGVSARKRHNMFCTIRSFRSNCNKTLICVIAENNGTPELFQRCIKLIIRAGFLVRGDIAIYSNAPIHANGTNTELQTNLTSAGIDAVLLPKYSPELNPIELVFSVMAQRFKYRYHESELNTDHDVLSFLYKVIDSIPPSIIVSCY